jgi:hypothetical protein
VMKNRQTKPRAEDTRLPMNTRRDLRPSNAGAGTTNRYLILNQSVLSMPSISRTSDKPIN